jgi:Spy/CpxP family protein refolding chaperone
MKSPLLFKLVICSLFVFALGLGQGRERPNPMPNRQGVMEKLNLTESQKKDVEKLNTDFAKRRVDQQAKVKTAQIELRALLKSDTPNKDEIEKKIGEIADLRAQNRVLGVEHWFAVNKLLTPDQQKIWKGMLDRTPRQRMAGRLGQMRHRIMRFFNRRPAPAQGDNP